MNRRLKLIAVLAIVFSMTAGVFTTEAANKDLTGDWFLWATDSSQQFLISALNTDVNGNPTYVLKQDGEKLICSGQGKFGQLTAEGLIKGNDFKLIGTAGNVDVRFEGKFEEGKINGKVVLGFDEANFLMKRK